MERYTQEGIIKGTDDELIIFDDGSVQYITQNVDGEYIVHDNCKMYSVGNKGGMRIKYGHGSSFSFKRYDNGEIDERWIKKE